MARTPLWQVIADTLRKDVGAGHYPPGARLPTEAELAVRFGVNRHTVRRAIAKLSDEKLVYSRRGSGVFVLNRPADYPLGQRVRFHQNLLAAGRQPAREVLSVEVRGASEDEATVLHLAPGAPVVLRRALEGADGQPLALGLSLFPKTRLPGILDALRTQSGVTAALAAVGVADYTRASTRVQARVADAAQAAQLCIAEGAPLLYTTGLNVDPDGLPVEFGQTWFAGDRITLTVEFPSS